MDDHARRLVDDQKMLVLEHDFQRDILRFIVRRLGLGNREAEALVAADFHRRIANRSPFALDGAAADQRLQPLARQSRRRGSQSAVDPPARMGRLQPHIDRPNAPHAMKYWVGSAAVQSLR